MDISVQGFDFDNFQLSGPLGPLLHDGKVVKLQPKTTALLWLLLQRAGEVVSKVEILDALWPEQDVGEDALSFQVRKLRKALGDDPHAPQFIATVHRLGYRFVGSCEMKTHANPVAPSTFVGREAEMARLRSAVQQAGSGQLQLVFVTGDAGNGKTALVQGFLGESRQATVVGQGSCHEHHQGSELYAVWIEVLNTLLRQPSTTKSLDTLKEVAPSWLARIPGLMGRKVSKELEAASVNAGRERLQREWLAILEVLSADQPLVLVVEDLHWADPPSLDLLSVMVKSGADLPMLILTSYRPVDAILDDHPIKHLKQKLVGSQKAEELALSPFDLEEVHALLQSQWADQPIGSEIAEFLHQRSEGHPLYLLQLLTILKGEQALDVSTLHEQLADVPESLRDLVVAQIDKLDPQEQRLLIYGSVIGQDFSTGLLAAALELPLADVVSICYSLSENTSFIRYTGLSVWPDGTTNDLFRFGHQLFQHALVSGMSEIEFARCSERIATRLEQAYARQVSQVAPLLAEYFALAGYAEKAIDYGIQTAYQALQVGEAEEASKRVMHAEEQCNRLSDPAAQEHAEMALAAIRIHIAFSQGGYKSKQVEEDAARLRLLLPRVEDAGLQENSLGLLWLTSFFSSHHADAMRHADRAIVLGRETNSIGLQCSGLSWQGLGALVLGDYQQAIALSEEAMALAQSSDWDPSVMLEAEPGATAISCSAQALWITGRPDAALERAYEGAARADMLKNPYMRCGALGTSVGSILLQRRDTKRLMKLCDPLLADCERYNHKESMLWVGKYRALGLCMMGQAEQGLPIFQGIMQMQRQAGATIALVADYALLAEQQLAANLPDACAETLKEGFDLLKQTGEYRWESELWRVQGDWCYQGNNDTTEAVRCYQRAYESADSRGALSYTLRAVMNWAKLEQVSGKHGQGIELLQHIYSRFTEGFDTPDLVEAKQLLGANQPLQTC